MTTRSSHREAEQLVARFSFSTPPVDVLFVARKLGLQVIEEDLGEGVSGILVTNPNEAYVCVQRTDHPNRKRFTIAHELGHFYLRHQFQPGEHVHVDRGNFISHRGVRASEGVDRKEIEANQFAAALLMPTTLVTAAVSSLAVSALLDHHVTDLAGLFEVSEQAMTIRLTTLGLL